MERERLHMEEQGIALLSALFVNSNRDPAKSQPAKQADFYHFPANTHQQLPGGACDAFLSLTREHKMPGWVMAIAPIDSIRANKRDGVILKPRAWVGETLCLIQPRIEGGKVRAGLAFVEEAGMAWVGDPDSGTQFRVVVTGDRRWSIDAEFDLEP